MKIYRILGRGLFGLGIVYLATLLPDSKWYLNFIGGGMIGFGAAAGWE